MYDTGNQVSAGGNSLTYGDDCDTMISGSQSYSMDITTNGISVMAFDTASGDFAVTGNLGADGSGARTVGSYNYAGWRGFWKQTHSASDPSVTHLWITNSVSAVADTTTVSTDS